MIGRTVMPGVFMSTRMKEMPSCGLRAAGLDAPTFLAGFLAACAGLRAAVLAGARTGFFAADLAAERDFDAAPVLDLALGGVLRAGLAGLVAMVNPCAESVLRSSTVRARPAAGNSLFTCLFSRPFCP